MPKLTLRASVFLSAGSFFACPWAAIAANLNCPTRTVQMTDEVSSPLAQFSWPVEKPWHSLEVKKTSPPADKACLREFADGGLRLESGEVLAAIAAEPGHEAKEYPGFAELESAQNGVRDPEILDDLTSPDFPHQLPSDVNSEQLSEPETELPPSEIEVGDAELGILRLREDPLPSESILPSPPVLYLLGRVDYLSSDNIFLNEVDPIGDAFVRPGLTLLAVPAVGPRTALIASASVNLLRYRQVEAASYDELSLQVGIRHVLNSKTFGQISWTNQQLFRSDFTDQFFDSHSLDLLIWRYDQLQPKLSLSSYYQARFSFSDPDEFSRIIQSLGASLFYQISPNLQTGLNYQLTLSDFTQQARFDAYHQLTAQVTYGLSASARLRLFGGISFGGSSENVVDFNDTLIGVTFDFDLPLF